MTANGVAGHTKSKPSVWARLFPPRDADAESGTTLKHYIAGMGFCGGLVLADQVGGLAAQLIFWGGCIAAAAVWQITRPMPTSVVTERACGGGCAAEADRRG